MLYNWECFCTCIDMMLFTQKNSVQDPISWIVGSDVVVVDPPRKGLEPSLVSALQMSTRQLKHTFSER